MRDHGCLWTGLWIALFALEGTYLELNREEVSEPLSLFARRVGHPFPSLWNVLISILAVTAAAMHSCTGHRVSTQRYSIRLHTYQPVSKIFWGRAIYDSTHLGHYRRCMGSMAGCDCGGNSACVLASFYEHRPILAVYSDVMFCRKDFKVHLRITGIPHRDCFTSLSDWMAAARKAITATEVS
jgi:hypothetical protein